MSDNGGTGLPPRRRDRYSRPMPWPGRSLCSTALVRAALLAVCAGTGAGCGDNLPPTFDAPPDGAADAAARDARVDAAPSGMVRVTVHHLGVAAEAALVGFHQADGTLVTMVQTDSAGLAEALVEAGTWVTAVVDPAGPDAALYTIAEVAPGDVLTIGAASARPPTRMTFNLPTRAGASGHRLFFGRCGEFTPTAATVTLDLECRPGAVTDLVVVAVDGAGQPLAATLREELTVSAGATVTVLADWVDATAVAVTYRGLDPAATSLGASLSSERPSGRAVTGPAATLTATAGVATTSLATVTLADSRAVHHLRLADGVGAQNRHDGSEPAASYDRDVGAELLPWLTAAPTFELAARRLRWTTRSGGASADAVVASVAFARAGASPVDGRWSVVAPAATELVLPVLPWAPAELQPSSGDTTGTSVRLVGGSDGYPGLRAFALTPSLDRFAGPGRLITSGLAVAE